MKNFDQFMQEWLGRRVDYDHVYHFQCVDLILEYIYECYGIASGVNGNAIDYWSRPSAPLLNKFMKVQTTEVQKGDIVVFNGLPGNPYGHVMIATGNLNAAQFEGLEQNGQNGDGDGGNADLNPEDHVALNDGNQIRTRWVNRNRIAGVLRPLPVNQPAPAAPVSPQPVVRVIKVAPGWGLERVAAAAGRQDARYPSCWEEISRFNGDPDWQHYNEHLQPNQLVKVPMPAGRGADEGTFSASPKRKLGFAGFLSAIGGTLDGYRAYKAKQGTKS